MSSELGVSSGSSGVCNTLLLVGDVVVSFLAEDCIPAGNICSCNRFCFSNSFCFANSSHFDCVFLLSSPLVFLFTMYPSLILYQILRQSQDRRTGITVVSVCAFEINILCFLSSFNQ
eukprot:492669_1